MRPVKVALDTNVLFDAALRDAFIRFHLVGLIHVAWSDAILAELDEALTPRLQPPNRERLLAALRALDLVEHGTVNTLIVLPDPNDVHVAQTALAAGADAIVTLDIDDFPDDVLAGYGLEVWSPEDAFVFLFAADHELVLTVLDDQRQALRKPPLDPDQFIARLGRTMPTVATMIGAKWGLPESVERADDMAHASSRETKPSQRSSPA